MHHSTPSSAAIVTNARASGIAWINEHRVRCEGRVPSVVNEIAKELSKFMVALLGPRAATLDQTTVPSAASLMNVGAHLPNDTAAAMLLIRSRLLTILNAHIRAYEASVPRHWAIGEAIS